MTGVPRALVEEQDGKRPPGRSRHRQDDNIKTDPKEIFWGCVDQTDQPLNRDKWYTLVNTVTKHYLEANRNQVKKRHVS